MRNLLKEDVQNILALLVLSLLMISCGTRYYKPSVMPTGKGELTRKQIRRDFTN